MKRSHDKHMLYYKETVQLTLKKSTAAILLNYI